MAATYDALGNYTGDDGVVAGAVLADGTSVGSTPVAGAPAGIDFTSAFNLQAAGKTFFAAGTLFEKDGTTYTTAEWAADQVSGEQPDVDVDATIKASSIDTNLDAILAGYKGTAQEASMTTFVETVRSHPELKSAMDAVLKDEGAGMIDGVTALATGEGAINMDQFSAAMQDPAKREVFANMLNRVATHELGPEYGVKFARAAMKAANNPDDVEARDEFTKIAEEGGVDIGPVQKKAMMAMFQDIWNNPREGIAKFVDSLQGLPPEWKEGLTGILGGIATFYKDIIGDFAFGHDGAPGLVDIVKNGADLAMEAGQRDRTAAGIGAPALG